MDQGALPFRAALGIEADIVAKIIPPLARRSRWGRWVRSMAVTVCFAFAPSMAVHAQSTNQILSLTPTNAAQGTGGLTVTFALDTDSPPAPPAGVAPLSVTLGSITGSAVSHASQYAVSATFAIPALEPVGLKDASVAFSTPNGTVAFTKTQSFLVTAGSGLAAGFAGSPTNGSVPLTVAFTDGSSGSVTGRLWSFGDGGTATGVNPSHVYTNTGSFSISLTVFGASGSNTLTRPAYVVVKGVPAAGGYTIVDTGQASSYNNTAAISAPSAGQPFYGQDAQCAGVQPSYTVSGDGFTVRDNRTGLTWQRSPETTGDGSLTAADKLTLAQALARPAALNAAAYGGFTDWRLPSIKELYSLIDFRGTDPSGLSGSDTSALTPFIDTNAFRFAYGDTASGERIIDSQYASSTLYVSTELEAELFGVNFADGRIKGYGLSLGGSDKTFFVQCVRGNPSYGLNLFVDNGDQTVTDQATGLMWTKADSGAGMNWSNALAWVQARNVARHLGHADWRLPNAKELQSIVDYTRSPFTTASPAIDPVFTCTAITNEKGQVDYPWYWSGTTHATYTGSGNSGCYVCFGRAMGYMNSTWVDVHGAGCQRSDPKGGSLTNYTYAASGYYNSVAPQGDAVRLYDFVRLVRDYPADADSVGDGVPDWWRARYFGGNGMTTNDRSCKAADPDGDGRPNGDEYGADTVPTNGASVLSFTEAAVPSPGGLSLRWIGGAVATQSVEARAAMPTAGGLWDPVITNLPPTPATNTLFDAATSNRFYRIRAWR